jgi:hypothetical protein
MTWPDQVTIISVKFALREPSFPLAILPINLTISRFELNRSWEKLLDEAIFHLTLAYDLCIDDLS